MYVRLPMMLVMALLALAGSVLSISGAESSHAQPGTATCPALVDLALERVDNSCSGLDRNSACYGFNNVQAAFSEEVEPEFFTQPSDRGALALFSQIQTAPLDLALEQWGVAVLSAQANIPNSLPGQAITFLLIGDVMLENEVSPDDAFVPVDPINVITREAIDVHRSPDANSDILDHVTTGTVLNVDARSGTGDWLRVIFDQQFGWLETARVRPSPLLSSLPTLSPESRSSLQAFSVTTSVRGLQCNDAPSALTIQSPEGLQIDLTVNGADISIGSTIIMQSISDTEFVLIVVEGHVEINGVIVEAGQAIVGMLDEDGNIVEWGEPRPATPEELATGDLVTQMLSLILDDDDGDGGSSSPGQNGDTRGGTTCGPNTTYRVVPGDTLFAISRRYGTTVAALVESNTVINGNIIVVGQVLNVPCGSDEQIFTPITNAAINNAGSQFDCAGFYPSSPRDGMPFGPTTFFWDHPAAGDFDGFRVNVYNENGELVASFDAGGDAFNVMGNTSGFGGGFAFAWEVVALADGVPQCVTERVNLFRASPPEEPQDEPEVQGPICGNRICEKGEDEYNCSQDCGYYEG